MKKEPAENAVATYENLSTTGGKRRANVINSDKDSDTPSAPTSSNEKKSSKSTKKRRQSSNIKPQDISAARAMNLVMESKAFAPVDEVSTYEDMEQQTTSSKPLSKHPLPESTSPVVQDDLAKNANAQPASTVDNRRKLPEDLLQDITKQQKSGHLKENVDEDSSRDSVFIEEATPTNSTNQEKTSLDKPNIPALGAPQTSLLPPQQNQQIEAKATYPRQPPPLVNKQLSPGQPKQIAILRPVKPLNQQPRARPPLNLQPRIGLPNQPPRMTPPQYQQPRARPPLNQQPRICLLYTSPSPRDS